MLEEGLTMPMSISLANSVFALANFAGERRPALADPGRAVVMIRCVRPWCIGMSLTYGVVREGNSLKRWVYGSILVSGVEILLKS